MIFLQKFLYDFPFRFNRFCAASLAPCVIPKVNFSILAFSLVWRVARNLQWELFGGSEGIEPPATGGHLGFGCNAPSARRFRIFFGKSNLILGLF